MLLLTSNVQNQKSIFEKKEAKFKVMSNCHEKPAEYQFSFSSRKETQLQVIASNFLATINKDPKALLR